MQPAANCVGAISREKQRKNRLLAVNEPPAISRIKRVEISFLVRLSTVIQRSILYRVPKKPLNFHESAQSAVAALVVLNIIVG
jgi:hypothetical protein